jgi:UDP-N-acetylglucosamine:LPS N-acetylglucosamine transferase
VENARFFEKAGAAVTLSGDSLDGVSLGRLIASLAEDTEKREAMAAASQRIGAIDGAALIADSIYTFIGEGS